MKTKKYQTSKGAKKSHHIIDSFTFPVSTEPIKIYSDIKEDVVRI